jgi:hypothetical protein
MTGRMARITNSIKRTPPGLTLLLLAPVLGELVSVHQTPLEFINPLNFIILSLPYGFGALICRELVVRWNKGWLSLLLLGLAYGVYEEALVVYSVFDPNWNELGSLERYGFFAGVNWTWGAMTVHFHAAISIGASVVLAGLIYPGQRHQRWLGKKALAGCFAGMLLWIPVMALIMILNNGRSFPPFGWYGFSWLAVFFLGWMAYRVPGQPFRATSRKVRRPVFFFLLGLVNMFVFFLSVFKSAELGFLPLWAAMLWLVVVDAATLWLVMRWSGNGYNWDDRHRLALFAGLLGFFIYFSFDKDFEHFSGTSLVGLATIIGLWRLWLSVNRRVKGQSKIDDIAPATDVG